MTTKKWVLTIISLILLFGFKYFPPVMGLNPIGMATLGITIGTIILLLGVNMVWPTFLAILAFAVNGVYTLNQAISGTFGGSIFWFLLINGMVIGAIEKTGLLKRIALRLLCLPIAKKSPWAFITIYLGSILLLGSLMNTTAVVLLFLALGNEILDTIGVVKGGRGAAFGKVIIFSVCCLGNISHAMTPFGHSNAIMTINYFNELGTPNLLQYSVVGYIVAAISLALYIVMMKTYGKLDVSYLTGFDPEVLRKDEKPMTTQEKIAGCVLTCIIFIWILPAIIQNPFPNAYKFLNSQLGIVAPLIAGMIILCLIPIDGKPIMNITDSLKTAPWAPAICVGISLYLGSAMQNEEAGMIDAFSATFTPICRNLPGFAFVALITFIVYVMTNFTSCALSTTVGSLISVALIQSGAVTGVNTMGLAFALTWACQAAIATPPSGAPGGILAGQGWITPGDQLKDGMIYNLILWFTGLIGYFVMGILF